MSEPLTTYRGQVSSQWVDYNGHMRDAFYLLIFSYASDAVMALLGLDDAGREATGHSLFTLECHLNYLREVKVGVDVEVRTQILGHDDKRLHLYHSLHLPSAKPTLATNEQMLLHVDVAGPFATPFSAPVLARVQGFWQEHQNLPVPTHVGRVISLGRAHA